MGVSVEGTGAPIPLPGAPWGHFRIHIPAFPSLKAKPLTHVENGPALCTPISQFTAELYRTLLSRRVQVCS